jgi:crossover junction endodeoxyribonuclease RuvC
MIIGVDPGKTGAFTLMDHGGVVSISDMPTLPLGSKQEIDLIGFRDLLMSFVKAAGRNFIHYAYIEKAQARPMQSATSTCVTCENYGAVRAGLVFFGITPREVRPQIWKEALGVPADKNAARTRATELLPDAAHWWKRAKDHNRAESAMIALYGLRDLFEGA